MSTVANTLAVAKVTSFLASDEIARAKLFGGPLFTSERYPLMITMERKIIERIYTDAPSYENLQLASDYLYDLCGKFKMAAQSIVDGGGGGSVTPIVPSVNYAYLEFIVSDSSQIPTGSSTYIFNTEPYDWRGLEVQFNRGNQPQGRIDVGGTYYTWNSDTGYFECFGVANEGEDFQFFATR